jgi:hypothetical protein
MKYFLLDIKQQAINQLYITNSKDFDLYIIVLYLRGILFLFLLFGTQSMKAKVI